MADEVDAALEAALRDDADLAPPSVAAPPRVAESADPDAPHGREDDGSPKAPYGLRADGRPRLKPAGPGRGHKGDKPRETDTPAAAAATAGKPAAGQQDYSAELTNLGIAVWIGASAFKGGTLPLIKIKLPDLQAHAMLWHEQMPHHVAAWNVACQQSPAVRAWVMKFAGEGGLSWVVGVGIVSANFLASATELAKPERAQIRKAYAEANSRTLAEFLAAQVPAATPAEPAQAAA